MKNWLFLGVLLVFLGTSTAMATGGSAPATGQHSIIGSGTFVDASGETIHAVYRQNKTVELTFSDGTKKTLSQAMSASGSRHVLGSNEWWEHQGEATYTVNDKPVFIGKIQR